MPKYLEDIENWMSLLPDQLRDVPLIHLAIPGSHNSMTYGITYRSKVAPDAEKAVRRLNRVFPFIVCRWAVTQKSSVTEQLKFGVRFFDLRLATNKSKIYFSHGLYSMEITAVLWQIRLFLDEHPGEFVILDFQHFYEFHDLDHERLQMKLRNIFSSKIYGRTDGPLTYCSLNNAQKLAKQVIIVYRNFYAPSDMWPGNFWPTPWANTTSIAYLREFLEDQLQARDPHMGFVSQCILTPTPKYIALRFCLSLKYVAKKVNRRLLSWIKEQTPGPFLTAEKPHVNVFLADFINLNGYDFCKIVIGLNQYLEV